MSFVGVTPEVVAAAATDLANIGSTINEAHAAAAALTTGLVPAAQDEVSAAIAALFGTYAQEYQILGAQAAAFHDRLVQAVSSGAGSYAAAEAANASLLQTVQQDVLNAVNAPTETLLGRPLISNGAGTSMGASAAVGAGAVQQLADPVGTTFVLGGSGMPTPTTSFLNAVNSLFIQPNLPGTTPVALSTPEQFYPFNGVNQLPFATSVSQGVQILNAQIQPYIAAGTPVGVFGYSQSAVIASLEMENLQAAGVPSSAVHFVLIGDLMNPNGGIFERFAGLQLASLGKFYGATPSNAYPTTIYTVEYDGWADFPRYPLDILSDLNAIQSTSHFTYSDLTPAQLNSAIQLPTSGATQTTYYMIPTTNLPLLDSTRGLPLIGNPIADLLQPDLTYLVNLGYGDPRYGWSTAPANVATPAGLFPPLSAFEQLPGLLASGTGQGIQNFIGDLTGTGPHPVTLPSLSSPTSPLAPSSGTASMTSALPDPMTAFSAVAANPAALAAALPNVINTLPSAASTAYGTVLLPTADILNAALISVPSYDANLFLDGILQAVNGQPVTGLVNAVGMPLAVDLALYPMLEHFEVAVLQNAGVPETPLALLPIIGYALAT